MSSESLRIDCPKCGGTLKIVAASPGEQQTCPKCGTRFLPPQRAASAATHDPNAEWDDLFGPSPTASAASPPPSTHVASSPAARATPPAQPPPAPASRPATPSPAPASTSPATPQRASGTPTTVRPNAAPERGTAADDAPLRLEDILGEDANAEGDASASAGMISTGASPQGWSGHPSARPRRSSDEVVMSAEAPVADAGDEDFRLSEPVVRPDVPVAEVAGRFTFAVGCKVCGTQIDCLNTDIGQTRQCPDCFTQFVVPTPRDTQTRTPVGKNPLATKTDDELKTIPVSTPQPGEQDLEAIRAQAAKLLARAKAEQEEIDQRESEHIDNSQVVDIFRFLIEPAALVRFAALTVGGMLGLFLLRAAVPLLVNQGTGMVSNLVALGLLVVGAPVCIVWLIAAAAHALAVFRDTATCFLKIDWPEVSFFEWLMPAMYVLLAALYSGLPGIVLGGLMVSGGLDSVWGLFMIVLSWIVFFPPTLISMTHVASIVGVVSPAVFRSMIEMREVWKTIYLASLFLGCVAWGGMVLALSESVVVVPIVVMGELLIGALYFRILGWMASRLAPVLSPDDEPASDSEKPAGDVKEKF